MTPEEAIAFWYGRIDYERRAPRPGDLRLDRMRSLLDAIGRPEDSYAIVHVAGTKGKGSSSAMIASVLRHAGFRTGLFTSPHLVDVRERIRVDGEPIPLDGLASCMDELAGVVRALEAGGDPSLVPTFFEIGTALGFLWFARQRVDIAVIEVGLGGRFDSTNVCTPLVSLITNISWDHMGLLGDTLGKIAFQKAGIIEPGRPVVATATEPEAVEVFERVAAENGCTLRRLGRDFEVDYHQPATPSAMPAYRVRLPDENRPGVWRPLGLLGRHQARNAAGAEMVVRELRAVGWDIPEDAIGRGMATVDWPARQEPIRRPSLPLVLLDCAHNTASVDSLIETVRETFAGSGRRHLIFAVSSDKQYPEMLALLAGEFDTFHLTQYRSNPRFVPAERLAEVVKGLRPNAEVYLTLVPEDAWTGVSGLAVPEDLIVIAGSVFLAGEMRDLVRS